MVATVPMVTETKAALDAKQNEALLDSSKQIAVSFLSYLLKMNWNSYRSHRHQLIAGCVQAIVCLGKFIENNKNLIRSVCMFANLDFHSLALRDLLLQVYTWERERTGQIRNDLRELLPTS